MSDPFCFDQKDRQGFTLIELMLSVAIISILATIALPYLIQLKIRAFNASAVNTGNLTRTCQELYYFDYQKYTNTLPPLVVVQSHLIDDPDVTFTFQGASNEGYTFTVQHFHGDVSYRWSEAKD